LEFKADGSALERIFLNAKGDVGGCREERRILRMAVMIMPRETFKAFPESRTPNWAGGRQANAMS